MAVTKINEFMENIGVKGGMSMTTAFDVQFDFTGKSLTFVDSYYSDSNKDVVTMLCDEAQLPNVQSATAQITGRYLGEGPVSYPHTRVYTDVSLGFMLDANLTALKFFSAWYDYIYGENPRVYNGTLPTALAENPRDTQRVNRLQYMDNYTCTAKIIKTEMSKTNKERTSEQTIAPAIYFLENCYPYSIDAVPLSYGSSQITRLTVNLYYTRHTVAYGYQDGSGSL